MVSYLVILGIVATFSIGVDYAFAVSVSAPQGTSVPGCEETNECFIPYEVSIPVFREAVKLAITPMISSLSILNYVDMETDAEVLGYGISLILLNVGMYVGVPAIIIVGIRKRF